MNPIQKLKLSLRGVVLHSKQDKDGEWYIVDIDGMAVDWNGKHVDVPIRCRKYEYPEWDANKDFTAGNRNE